MQNKNKNKIPVVFTPDEFYFIPTAVAIASMLASKYERTEYFFYIVVSENVRAKAEKFFADLAKKIAAFEYKVLAFDTSLFDNQTVKPSHVTTATYYRLFLSELLDDEKILYHDGDILAFDDMTSMFEFPMGENYVAGILDPNTLNEKNYEEKNKEWKMKSLDQYIMGGDLIFNLKQIKEDNMTTKFLAAMQKAYPSEDQAVVNICCYNKIAFLPIKYCIFSRWMNNDVLETRKIQVFTKKEIEEAKSNPVVMHFPGTHVKPWGNLRGVGSSQWWYFAKQILPQEEFNKWYKNAEYETTQRDWDSICNNFEKKDSLILFGAGKLGMLLFELLAKHGYNIVAFADNNSSLWGTETNGIRIYNIEDILKLYPKAKIVITTVFAKNIIKNQLVELGVKEENIFVYNSKTKFYYHALHENFYKYELLEIIKQETLRDMCDCSYQELLQVVNNNPEWIEKYYLNDWLLKKGFTPPQKSIDRLFKYKNNAINRKYASYIVGGGVRSNRNSMCVA